MVCIPDQGRGSSQNVAAVDAPSIAPAICSISGSAISRAMTLVTTTLMDAVGPEIWDGVPPHRLASTPATIEAYSPASAPLATY